MYFQSMQMMHMEAINICDSNIKERIKEAWQGDEHFKYVRGFLDQEPKGPMG